MSFEVILSGCFTSSPRQLDVSLTGEICSFLPLPDFLSGWQNTLTSSPEDFCNASNDGTAKSGVPRKTILIIMNSFENLENYQNQWSVFLLREIIKKCNSEESKVTYIRQGEKKLAIQNFKN